MSVQIIYLEVPGIFLARIFAVLRHKFYYYGLKKGKGHTCCRPVCADCLSDSKNFMCLCVQGENVDLIRIGLERPN